MRVRLGLGFALLSLALFAPSALAAYNAYTPQKPAYDVALSQGRLSTQVRFGGGPTFQWGLQLNAKNWEQARGPMTEDADIYCNGRRISGYHDHHVVPASYFIHSTYRPLNTSCNYQLVVNEVFRIEGGTRYIYTRLNFYISYA